MGIGSVIKKKIFDIAKDSKAIRVVLRSERDALYRAKMVLDDPFVKIDDRLVYFQTFSGRGYSDSPKAMYEYMLKAPEYSDYRFVWSFRDAGKYSFLLNNDRTEVVEFRSRADNKALRRAKYWISNYRMLDYQYPRKGQVYLAFTFRDREIRDCMESCRHRADGQDHRRGISEKRQAHQCFRRGAYRNKEEPGRRRQEGHPVCSYMARQSARQRRGIYV